MLVLVTRPREQAAATARLLRAAGHEALIDPLLEIARLPLPELAPGEAAAAAVTSANAARAAAALASELPIFAVGAATAQALRAVGRVAAGVADGDGRSLAALIGRSVPGGGTILHLCGRDVREGLAAALAAAGYTWRPVVVYEAVAASRLAPTTESAIREHRLGAALFYSPRSAAVFAALARTAGLDREFAPVVAGCLSEAVASSLAGLGFGAVRVADRPAQDALLRRLEG